MRLLWHTDMVLPSFDVIAAIDWWQSASAKSTYVGLPNQCVKCRQICHMAKYCMWQNATHGNSMEKFKDKVWLHM